MEIEMLIEQNQWWKDKSIIEEDYDIQKWKEKKYKWIPSILEEIELKPFSLHILLGPRQAGKTTVMKLLIKQLLKKTDSKSLFYFNCEAIGDCKELMDIIESYLMFKEDNNIKNSLIILDEITSPKEWYKGIKLLIDKGRLKKETVILTGSSSITIKKQVELFPGRRGNGKDFILMPLSFREFIKVINPSLYEKIEPIKNFENEELRKKSVKSLPYLKELNALLSIYKNYGGFPLGIESINKNKEDAKRVYLNWIKNAVLKAERSDLIARQIIKTILEKIPSPISWENVSKQIEIKSPKTVSAYIELLKSIFALYILYNIDINHKTIKFGKNKKIHFIDPLLLELLEDWCLVKIKNKDNLLAESMVANILSRKFPEKSFFWKNGFEIDSVIIDNKKLRGFEVKWSEDPKLKKLPQFDSLVLITKKDFLSSPLKIPLSIFLSIIE